MDVDCSVDVAPDIRESLDAARRQIAETQAKLLESAERVAMLENLIEQIKRSVAEQEAKQNKR